MDEIRPTSQRTLQHKAFVLRISISGTMQQRWQATLVDVKTGNECCFAAADDLLAFLTSVTTGPSQLGKDVE